MSLVIEKLTEIVIDLPEESQAEVIDFAEFLREKNGKSKIQEQPKERVFGMYQGEIWMSDDFSESL